MRLGVAVAAVTAAVALSPSAYALQAHAQTSTRRVGVGESFYVQLSVMSDGQISGELTDARLPLPPGLKAERPTASSQSTVNMITGRSETGLVITWVVTASRVGTFKIGSPSVKVGAERVQDHPLQIEVVAGGTSGGPARRGFDPFDMLDPFGRGNSPFPPGFPPGMRGMFDGDDANESEPAVPPEISIDKADDPVAFLRATATPTQVVVGQQVMLRLVAYGARGLFSIDSFREPSHPDFLAFPNHAQTNERFYPLAIGGVRFVGKKVFEQALFPLHAGTLRVGNMRLGFPGRGYPTSQTGQSLTRESNWIDVVVTDPPMKGRPPGYKLGDVGDFTLSATVEPRQVIAGDSVSVVATLSGVGNLPFKLQTPEGQGIEWQEPSLTEKIDPTEAVVRGSRTFSYVVRLPDAGKVDLGELTLPHYNPERHAYAVARVSLGVIEIKANPKAASVAPEPKPLDRLAGVLRPRDALGPQSNLRAPLSDRGGFWLALLFAPLGVVFLGGALDLASRARAKLRARGTSLAAQLEAALREARELAKHDTQSSVAAVERAVFLAIELKLGLKARAVLKTELAKALVERGLSTTRAAALAQLLEDCDTLRFVGSASGIDPVELAQRAAQNSAETLGEKPTVPS